MRKFGTSKAYDMIRDCPFELRRNKDKEFAIPLDDEYPELIKKSCIEQGIPMDWQITMWGVPVVRTADVQEPILRIRKPGDTTDGTCGETKTGA